MKIKVNVIRNNLINVFLLAFFLFIALGAYWRTNTQLIAVYLILGIALSAGNWGKLINRMFSSRLLLLWCVFIVESVVSMVFNGMYIDVKSIYITVALFIITFVFVELGDTERLIRMFRNIILMISIIVLCGYLIKYNVFSVFKEGTPYYTLDSTVGGVSGLFEFRHYYGAFLASALWIQLCYPFRIRKINALAVIILIINIVLTYTRNTWIACVVCLFLLFIRKHRFTMKRNTVLKIIYVIIAVAFGVFVFKDTFSPIINNVYDRLANLFVVNSSNGMLGGARAYSLVYGAGYILSNWLKYIWIGGGSGFAMLWLAKNPYAGWWINSIDCQYVTTFMNQGLIGLIILMVIIVKIFRGFMRSTSKKMDALYLSMIVIIVEMAFFEVLGTSTSIFVWFTICLCAISKEGRVRKNEN